MVSGKFLGFFFSTTTKNKWSASFSHFFLLLPEVTHNTMPSKPRRRLGGGTMAARRRPASRDNDERVGYCMPGTDQVTPTRMHNKQNPVKLVYVTIMVEHHFDTEEPTTATKKRPTRSLKEWVIQGVDTTETLRAKIRGRMSAKNKQLLSDFDLELRPGVLLTNKRISNLVGSDKLRLVPPLKNRDNGALLARQRLRPKNIALNKLRQVEERNPNSLTPAQRNMLEENSC